MSAPAQTTITVVNGITLQDQDGFSLTWPSNGGGPAWASRMADRWNKLGISVRQAVAVARTRPDGSTRNIPEDTSTGVWGPKVANAIVDNARQAKADSIAAGERTGVSTTDTKSLLKQRWGILQKALPGVMKDPVKAILVQSHLPAVSTAFFKGSLDLATQVEASDAVDQVQVFMDMVGVPYLAKDLQNQRSTGTVLPNVAPASEATAISPAQLLSMTVTESAPAEEVAGHAGGSEM